LDGEDGPVFSAEKFPKGVGFYEKIIKTAWLLTKRCYINRNENHNINFLDCIIH
jgi:hypothetical protein